MSKEQDLKAFADLEAELAVKDSIMVYDELEWLLTIAEINMLLPARLYYRDGRC